MGLKILIAVMVLLAAVAIPSGILLIIAPSGSLMGGQFILPLLTKDLPFIHDFEPVGIWLVSVYGVLPIILIIGLWRRVRVAWLLSTALGVTVVAWIGVELLLFYSALGFTPLYPLIGGIGLAIVILSLLAPVRRYYRYR